MDRCNFGTGQITVTFHGKGNYNSFKRHLKKILLQEALEDHCVREQCEVLLGKTPEEMAGGQGQDGTRLPAPYSPELNRIERAG